MSDTRPRIFTVGDYSITDGYLFVHDPCPDSYYIGGEDYLCAICGDIMDKASYNKLARVWNLLVKKNWGYHLEIKS